MVSKKKKKQATIYKYRILPNVSLSDENSGVVDRFSQSEFENLSLETAFQEIFNLKTQDVIELGFGFIQHTDTNKSSDQSITFEKTLGVFLSTSKKVTSSTTDFRKSKTDTVDFSFVTETVFTSKFKFLVETVGLERTFGDLVAIFMISLISFIIFSRSIE